MTLDYLLPVTEISAVYRLLNGQEAANLDNLRYVVNNPSMGLIDRAFGADKHTMANYRFTIHWRAAQQRFEEHREKCTSKSDLAICDELIEICSEVMKEIDYAKKGFGVFAYEKPFFNSKLETVTKLVFQLEFTYPDLDKVVELAVETTNILERRYR